MAKILNRKPSRVGLLRKNGQTMYFDPGEHMYAEEDLDDLAMERAGVRAYWEKQGDKPAVLENMTVGGSGKSDDDAKPPSAADMKKAIAESTDFDWLKKVVDEDDRSTVTSAALERLNELDAATDPAVDPPGETE